MSEITLHRLERAAQAVTTEVRKRALASVKAKHTEHYAAREGDRELAFVSLDLNPQVEYLVLYELFVPKVLRECGVGSRVLSKIEQTAKELGYRKVTLSPKPLEPDGSSVAELIEWYQRRGYSESPGHSRELEKSIV